jgi:hypothetical protein
MDDLDLRYEDLASDEAIALIYFDETKKGKRVYQCIFHNIFEYRIHSES